jgi:glucokinase
VVALAERACRDGALTLGATGVGCGGPMVFPEGIVSPLHIPVWRGFPLRERLEAALGLPVSVDNDAKALALGEARFGAGRGARCLLGMVVSTGVGGGVVTDGRLLHGASGNAGHAGHVIVAARGPRCECGAVGCVTAYASGVGLAARARVALRRGAGGALAALPREAVTAETIAVAAHAGDPLASRLYREAGQALARMIASAAALLDLDRVVLGGGVTLAGDPLFVPLREELRRRAHLDFTREIDVRLAALGPESGVVGAAALALPER